MRFRLIEDERRYNALRVEMYLRLAKLPAPMVSDVLRNISKIEALLFWEGVKQGVAMAAIDSFDPVSGTSPERIVPDIYRDTPTVAHAKFYGPIDTPLAAMEIAYVKKLGDEAEPDHPWIARQPAEFAPLTLAEATTNYGPDLNVQPAPEQAAATPVAAPRPAPAGPPVDSGVDAEFMDQLLAAHDAAEEAGEEMPPESPAYIDRIRDELLRHLKAGWKPNSWRDLILHLHREMGVAANFLDLQLSTEVGRTMLAQVGLPSIFPGLGVLVNDDGEFAGVREVTE